MQATNLKTNHLTQPLGIDAGTLFLSWQCAEGVRQTAYEIEVTAGAETLWASGKILSSVMHTETPTPVPPKTRDSGASGCGMKTTSPVRGAKPSLKRVCPLPTGRACGSARKRKSRISTAPMQSTPLQNPTGSRSRRRWKPPAKGRRSRISPPSGKLSAQGVHRPGRRKQAAVYYRQGSVYGMAERQAGRRYGACSRQLYRRQAPWGTDLRCDSACSSRRE